VQAQLLSVGVSFARDRVSRQRRRVACARPDEDAVTLAAVAAAPALEAVGVTPRALLFASITPPYDEGGSAQPLAELLRLPARLFSAELTATARDGLGALRLGMALAGQGQGPVLVCAAHRPPAGGGSEGAGAVALVLGTDAGIATLRAGPSHTEELRDRWRLAGDAEPHQADRSFVEAIGVVRLASLLAAADSTAAGDATAASAPVAVSALAARAANSLEQRLGGPGDDIADRLGHLGPAHPLLRLAASLETPTRVIAVGGGAGDVITVEPGPGAAEVARAVRDVAHAGVDVEHATVHTEQKEFSPFASVARSWRDRAQDLRLEGSVTENGLCYPPAAGAKGSGTLAPLARRGHVLTWTRDRVYPGAPSTDMAVIELDDGVRFYGQVADGEEVATGDRVELVPRRLHTGGNFVQYFWKVSSCR
jgi:hypothetical protein